MNHCLHGLVFRMTSKVRDDMNIVGFEAHVERLDDAGRKQQPMRGRGMSLAEVGVGFRRGLRWRTLGVCEADRCFHMKIFDRTIAFDKCND